MGNTAGPLPPILPAQVGGAASFPARLAPLAGSQTVALALPAGARVVAEVVQSQTDGQVLLRLGQTLLAATLPGQPQVGDKLPLIVLSEPGAQPTLLLAPQSGSAATQAELSSTAQLLARLQQQPAQPLRTSAVLWPQPDGTSSPQLAQALAAGVRNSGLFYESHLAAWVQGELPTQALLQEPQGSLSPLARQAASSAPQASQASPQEPPGSAGVAVTHQPLVQAQPGAQPQWAARPAEQVAGQTPPQAPAQTPDPTPGAAGPGGGAAAAAAAPAPPAHAAATAYASMQSQAVALGASTAAGTAANIPAQLQALVQQQLATLAQGAVVWAGQAWPGQELEWRIEPDAQQAAQAQPASRSWTSVLRLDLPQLGPLVVTLHLGAGQHLRVRVEHAPQAGALLQSRGADFRQALQGAGLQLDELALRARSPQADG